MNRASGRLLRNERWLHGGMAAAMVLFLSGAFGLRNHFAQCVESIADDRAECVKLLDSEGEIKEAFSLATEVHRQLCDEYRSILDRIPNKVVDSEVMSLIRGVALSSNCSLVNFRPTATQKLADFQTRSFDLHLEGQFTHLFLFFEKLLSSQLVYQISRFKILESSVPGGSCRIDIELKIVFDHVWAKTREYQ
jgi:hypothetical protein